MVTPPARVAVPGVWRRLGLVATSFVLQGLPQERLCPHDGTVTAGKMRAAGVTH